MENLWIVIYLIDTLSGISTASEFLLIVVLLASIFATVVCHQKTRPTKELRIGRKTPDINVGDTVIHGDTTYEAVDAPGCIVTDSRTGEKLDDDFPNQVKRSLENPHAKVFKDDD